MRTANTQTRSTLIEAEVVSYSELTITKVSCLCTTINECNRTTVSCKENNRES